VSPKRIDGCWREGNWALLESCRPDVASELLADIVGHLGSGETETRYASPARQQQMMRAIKKLPLVTGTLSPHPIRLRSAVVNGDARPSRPNAPGRRVIIEPLANWSGSKMPRSRLMFSSLQATSLVRSPNLTYPALGHAHNIRVCCDIRLKLLRLQGGFIPPTKSGNVTVARNAALTSRDPLGGGK
jgi:hypothetical protein